MRLVQDKPVDRASTSGWEARLRLGFERVGEKTVLSSRTRSGPLAVQRPFYPAQGGAHVYILHPPGGVVGGDGLDIRVEVSEGAEALVTTPGAAKLYRSAGDQARIVNTLNVDGILEWLPQENIFFDGARVRQRTQILLGAHSIFMGWEIHCLGRLASRETFRDGSLDLGVNIQRSGVPINMERLGLDGVRVNGRAGLRGLPVAATFYAAPVDAGLCESVRQWQCQSDTESCGITLLNDLMIVRYLGTSAAAARSRLQQVWQHVRPALTGRGAVTPRIWST